MDYMFIIRVIYGDYNLEDGTGVKQNAELGRGRGSVGTYQILIDPRQIRDVGRPGPKICTITGQRIGYLQYSEP